MDRPRRALGDRARFRNSARAATWAALALLTAPALGAEQDAGVEPSVTVVTATRSARPVREVPASVTVLPSREIARSPTLTTDELLRTVPGAATFRANSSVVADPTSQGLNLRGVGPSGVSRALLLVDGVPANEPFGNWIFWKAFPRIGLAQMEISPGPASALYGSAALGGVVQLISRPLTPSTFDAELSLGSQGLVTVAGRATHRKGPIALGLEGEFLRSDGYPIVAPEQAGPIDQRAFGNHGVLTARLEWTPSEDWSIHLRGGYFGQSQNGGTTFTTSGIERWETSVVARRQLAAASELTAIAYFRQGTFTQQRARIAADRSTEVLAVTQSVPTVDVGASLVWTGAPVEWGLLHAPTVGLDFRRSEGQSNETLSPPALTTASIVARGAGGEQQFFGVFIQDELRWRWLRLVATLRYDLWRNLQGRVTTTPQSGAPESVAFADRLEHQLSPRLGFLIRPVSILALRGSVGTGFREPTLNELYRSFQVGTIRTAANDALVAEHLVGGELGLELEPVGGLRLRTTGFFNQLTSPISNATLATPLPDGSQRQKQNLGAARIAGLELGVEARFATRWTIVAGYLLSDARVTDGGASAALVGKVLPLAPAHRGNLSLTFSDPRILTATLQLQVVGPTFEDDRNTLPIGWYPLLDASVSRELRWGLEVYAAVQNVFDRRYVVGRAGIDTSGAPLQARGGLRFRSP